MPEGYNFLQMTIPLGKETKAALLFKTSVGRGGAGGPGLVSHNVFSFLGLCTSAACLLRPARPQTRL